MQEDNQQGVAEGGVHTEKGLIMGTQVGSVGGQLTKALPLAIIKLPFMPCVGVGHTHTSTRTYTHTHTHKQTDTPAGCAAAAPPLAVVC